MIEGAGNKYEQGTITQAYENTIVFHTFLCILTKIVDNNKCAIKRKALEVKTLKNAIGQSMTL